MIYNIIYNCQSILYNSSNNIMLLIEYPYKFVKVLKYQTATEKETITLLCELDDETGDVKWFKGDQEILSDKR
jgi:hypothetical protein